MLVPQLVQTMQAALIKLKDVQLHMAQSGDVQALYIFQKEFQLIKQGSTLNKELVKNLHCKLNIHASIRTS